MKMHFFKFGSLVFSLSLSLNPAAFAVSSAELKVTSDNQVVMNEAFQKNVARVVSLVENYLKSPVLSYDAKSIPDEKGSEFVAKAFDEAAQKLMQDLQEDRSVIMSFVGYYTKKQVREHAQIARDLVYAINQIRSNKIDVDPTIVELKLSALQRAYKNSKRTASIRSNLTYTATAVATSLVLMRSSGMSIAHVEDWLSKEVVVLTALALSGSIISNMVIEEDLNLDNIEIKTGK